MASGSRPQVGGTSGMTTRRRKRIQPPVYGGDAASYCDKDNDFVCPVCFEIIEEAYMTKCGHTFCHKCIRQSLTQNSRCPRCNFILSADDIFPNFILNELILKHKSKVDEKRVKFSDQAGLSPSVNDLLKEDDLDLSSVNNLLEYLNQKRSQLVSEAYNVQYQLLSEFLQQIRQRKQQQMDEIQKDLRLIDQDLCKSEELSEACNKSVPIPASQEFSLLNGRVSPPSPITSVPMHNTHKVNITAHIPNTTHMSNSTHINNDSLVPNSSIHIPNTSLQHVPNISTHLPNTSSQVPNLNSHVPNASSHVPNLSLHMPNLSADAPKSSSHAPNTIMHSPTSGPQSFNGSSVTGKPWLQTTMASRRKRITQHFDDLEQYYFMKRRHHTSMDGAADEGLTEFIDCLSKFTRFTSFRPLATLGYASDIYNGSSIVSSIEFDRDCDYFAIAGVTKKIKVFEYETIIRDAVDIHYPVNEMICNSKISSLTWSTYHKGLMASSDYEGTVTLWDAFTGVKSKVFQEHEKRCWSVDFNRMDPKLLASGSDDAKVKVWSTNCDHSLSSLEAKANVCCVKFSPTSRFHLAFGSADHCVHYYDLRNTKQPLVVFRGHKKAVSYVKFINSHELVSASTDSQLKSWNLSQSSAIRTFTGHVNDKNFVGLASDGDYISCGSENNSLYIYYKGLSKHLLSYKFDTVRSVLEKDKKEEETTEFVSAVSWRPGSNVLVAANSLGTVKVMSSRVAWMLSPVLVRLRIAYPAVQFIFCTRVGMMTVELQTNSQHHLSGINPSRSLQ